jgi:DNA primase
MFDADDAGRKATMKAAIVSETAGLNVQAAILPPGTDPADILLAQGSSALKKIVERPINIFSYLLNLQTGTRSDHSGEAQEEVLEELTPYLDAVGSELRQEAYLRELAETIKADPNTVLREYRSRAGRKTNPTVRTPVNGSRDSKPGSVFEPAGDDLFLMAAVAVRTEYFTTVRNMLAPELLRDSRALSLYRALEELSCGGETPRTDEVVELLEDENLRFYIIEKAAEGIYDQKAEQTIFEKVRSLKLRALSDERQELLNGLKDNVGADPEINKARITRIQQIDQYIMRIRQGEDGGN